MDWTRHLHLRSPFKSKMKDDFVDVDDVLSKENGKLLSGSGRSKSFNSSIFNRIVGNSDMSVEDGRDSLHKNKSQSLLSAFSSPSLNFGSPFKKLTNHVMSKSTRGKNPPSNVLDTSIILPQSSTDGVKLTLHERQLVKDAWHTANKKKGNAGIWIFKWLFANYPFLKETFHLETIPDDKLELNEKFQMHARTFSDVLEMVVDSMDALDDSLGPLIVSYGAKHVAFEKRHKFKPEYWNYFACAMCEYASQSWKPILNVNNETLHAWRMLVFFLVSKVKEGFYLEKQRLSELETTDKVDSV